MWWVWNSKLDYTVHTHSDSKDEGEGTRRERNRQMGKRYLCSISNKHCSFFVSLIIVRRVFPYCGNIVESFSLQIETDRYDPASSSSSSSFLVLGPSYDDQPSSFPSFSKHVPLSFFPPLSYTYQGYSSTQPTDRYSTVHSEREIPFQHF